MFSAMNPQVIAALLKLIQLKQEEGLLLALHPNFILMIRPGMDGDAREDAADALLSAAEGLSLPVMEDSGDKDEGRQPDDPPGYAEEGGLPEDVEMKSVARTVTIDSETDKLPLGNEPATAPSLIQNVMRI